MHYLFTDALRFLNGGVLRNLNIYSSSVSAFKGQRETDVSGWHATNYATVVYWKV